MRLDFKKIITKIVPSLAFALIFTLTGTGVMGCSNASINQGYEIIPEYDEITPEYDEITSEYDEILPVEIKDGVGTIYGTKVNINDYYLISENKLYEMQFLNNGIVYNPIAKFTRDQVEELKMYTLGEYVDPIYIKDSKLIGNFEIMFVKDGNFTVVNSIYTAPDEEMTGKIPEEYKEEIYNALNGYIINLSKLQ